MCDVTRRGSWADRGAETVIEDVGAQRGSMVDVPAVARDKSDSLLGGIGILPPEPFLGFWNEPAR
jgi:hypothetical protein